MFEASANGVVVQHRVRVRIRVRIPNPAFALGNI